MMKIDEALLNEFWVPFDNSVTADNNWANSDIRPCKFDVTLEKWLERIGTWGNVEFFYYSDEPRVIKQKLNKAQFLDKIQSTDLLKLYGKFRVEIRHIYEMDLIREYVGLDGKMKNEIFKVYVKLHKDLKKGLTLWTKFFN